MLDAVAADACSGMHTMAQAVACESEACQRAAIMIASLTTSWTSFSDDQLDQLADAGAVRGLARSVQAQCPATKGHSSQPFCLAVFSSW